MDHRMNGPVDRLALDEFTIPAVDLLDEVLQGLIGQQCSMSL
jgi:hypothetical protein